MIGGGRLGERRVTWLRRGWPALSGEIAVILSRIREYA
jgi:phosphoadenosine phosphosulfate reductase